MFINCYGFKGKKMSYCTFPHILFFLSFLSFLSSSSALPRPNSNPNPPTPPSFPQHHNNHRLANHIHTILKNCGGCKKTLNWLIWHKTSSLFNLEQSRDKFTSLMEYHINKFLPHFIVCASEGPACKKEFRELYELNSTKRECSNTVEKFH